MSDSLTVVLGVLTGVLTGTLSGMFGVGGAVISTPAIRALGASPLDAVGSTIPSILPSAVAGALRYRREGLVRERVVIWTSSAGAVAAVGGALLTDVLPGNGHLLMIITAIAIVFSAYRVSRPPTADELPVVISAEGATDAAPGIEIVPHERTRHDDWSRLVVTGVAAGTMSGLLGVGGGLVTVPLFTGWIRLSIKEALGTSLACVGILSIPGMVTHIALGHVDWLYALPLCVGVIPGARLGSGLAIRSSDATMRILVGIVLGAIGIGYGISEIIALT